MMVFFGDPETKGEKEDARICIEMALEMQERMVELREKWAQEGFAEPFEIRMGVNTGYCNVGNFGSDQRLTYTIIGGEVNVAARLEQANKEFNTEISFSHEIYTALKTDLHIQAKFSGEITLKGRAVKTKVYSI